MLLLGKHGDVVLERIWDPKVLAANVGDTLVSVPVALVGKGLINDIVEVLVVREDNVASDVVELEAQLVCEFDGQIAER